MINNICITCNSKINILPRSRKNRKFCSTKCHKQYIHDQRIVAWKSGTWDGMTGFQLGSPIRKYLLKKFDNKCTNCGWGKINPFTNKFPLEIEHIDGNPYNNHEENLTVLCPNCHSLTKSYKGANKGNGRKGRTIYSLYNMQHFKLKPKKILEKNSKTTNYSFTCVDCDTHISLNARHSRCAKCSAIAQRKVTRPPIETLLQEIKESSYVAVGRKYGVSDNAIRKWIKIKE